MILSFETLVTFSTLLLNRLCRDLGIRSNVPFYNPTLTGGSMLDDAGDGLGEPLNVGPCSLSESALHTSTAIGYNFRA